MDFFSEKELVTQTGHSIEEWPLVIIKELVDNSLDACEEAGSAPVIEITADATGIMVTDNGPGMPESTLKGAMDFTVRTSNREAYVAPDRGAQGNALKTLLPMPWVVDPDHGKLVIEAGGIRHSITCGCDPISQRAAIHDQTKNVKTDGARPRQKPSFIGTSVRLEWGPSTDEEDNPLWPFDEYETPTEAGSAWEPSLKEISYLLVEGFSLFNRHATIRLDWFGDLNEWQATDTDWRKWKPSQPTSCHWYELSHFERLIGAYITHDREAGNDRLVSDFIAEFDGLTSSQKRSRVLDETDLRRVNLSEFVSGDRLDSGRIEGLLRSMQKHTKVVTARRLGEIGEDHLRERLLAMGIEEESFTYQRKRSKEGLPWVLESAFGWLGEDAKDRRRIFAGANWSSAIKNPFRSFGITGEGLEATLSDLKVGAHEPIVFALHLAQPRVEYTDRGKSALVIGSSA